MEQARISTPQGNQQPQAARSTRAHTQQKGLTDDAGGASAMPGSFLALLAAQDPELTEGDPLAATPGAADASLLAGQAPADPAALTGWQTLVAADAVAAQALAGQNAAMAAGDGGTGPAIPTVGLGQPGAGRGVVPNAGMEAAGLADGAAALNARLQAPATDGLVAQTTALDGSTPAPGAPAASTMGFGRQFSRMHAAALQRGGESATTTALAGAGEATGRAGGRADAKQSLSQGDMLSAAPAALAAAVREAGAGAGGHRAPGEALGAASPDAALLASQDLVGGATAASARNADAGGGDASRHGGAGGLGEGGPEASTYSIDGASGTPGFDELAQASIEEQLAEQVTYWANQTSQSAEMTLNRDGQPLAVTVSLSGNEAHISFRSDQENTRTLLDQNMAQLSDLLRGEGLVLSGMTVGTSGGQGANAGGDGQQRDRRPGDGQQGTVKVGGPTDVSQRLAGSSARSSGVDVFV